MPCMTKPIVPSASPARRGALEWRAPVLVRIDERTTLPALLRERVSRSADRPLVARKQETSEVWRTITARDFSEESRRSPPDSSAWGWDPASESPSCRAPATSGHCSTSPAGPPPWSRSPSTRRARPSRSRTSSPTPTSISSSPRRSPWPSSSARPPPRRGGRALGCCPWTPTRSTPSPTPAAPFPARRRPSAPTP